MKRAIQLFCLAMLPLTIGFSQQASQAILTDNWHDDSIVPTSFYNNRYNECWGFAINGHEYGVIGSTAGMHFIDVTNPSDIFEAFKVPGASTGTNLVHRDMKHYNGYLYCVADEGPSKLQIIDLQNLPNSVTQVYSSNEFVTTAHNLYIDTSQQRLYLLGAGGQTKVLDISNPTQPVLLASYPNPNYYMPYTHDGFVKDNIGFFNCGGSGLWIIDFTNPLAPVTLSTLTTYTDAGYNHSGWLTEDGNYYILCDETHGARVKVLDVSDLAEPKEVATIEPGLWTSEIPHNVLVRGNYAYFSYYYDGLEVWDISNPLNPQRAYFYDTYPAGNVASYAGAWGVNPNLPSGNILVSDMQGGLFVLASIDSGTPNTNIFPSQNDFDICLGETVTFNLIIGNGFSSNGVTLSVGSGSLPADVQFSQNPAMPGSTVQVTVNNIASTQGLADNLVIVANDGVEGNSTSVAIAVNEAPTAAAQSTPLENATGVSVNASFQWQTAAGASSYKLQVADDLAAFDSHVIYSANTAATSFTLSNSLVTGKTYYWRVTAKNDCGSTLSPIRTFTTEGVNATNSIEGVSVAVYPNPAHDFVQVTSSEPLPTTVRIALVSTAGQVLLQRDFQTGTTSLSLPVSDYPAGIYIFKMASEHEVLVKRIVVE
jgi:choice-of-anchor B domain-containing protein